MLHARRAAFFPVCSLDDKRNFKRLLRIERDGSVVERIFLDVSDQELRERLICLHYLRHLTRHFLQEDIGVNILSRDAPWDFRARLHNGREFNIEITSIADNARHFEIDRREERLTRCSRTETVTLRELGKLADMFPHSDLPRILSEYRASCSHNDDLVPNPFFQEKHRVLLGQLFEPDQSLASQIESAVEKKCAKPHQDKHATVLVIDNRTSAFDVPDYQMAVRSLEQYLRSTPFPEIWFYTGYCSDDDGNRAEFSFAPLKITDDQRAVLENLAFNSDANGRVVW